MGNWVSITPTVCRKFHFFSSTNICRTSACPEIWSTNWQNKQHKLGQWYLLYHSGNRFVWALLPAINVLESSVRRLLPNDSVYFGTWAAPSVCGWCDDITRFTAFRRGCAALSDKQCKEPGGGRTEEGSSKGKHYDSSVLWFDSGKLNYDFPLFRKEDLRVIAKCIHPLTTKLYYYYVHKPLRNAVV